MATTALTSAAEDVDPEPSEIDWSPEQLAHGLAVAAAHGLGHLSAPEAAFYAYCSVAFWYFEDHGQVGPNDEPNLDEVALMVNSARWPGPDEEYAGLLLYSPNYCSGRFPCRRAGAAAGAEEVPF